MIFFCRMANTLAIVMLRMIMMYSTGFQLSAITPNTLKKIVNKVTAAAVLETTER